MERKRILIVEDDLLLAELCAMVIDASRDFTAKVINGGCQAARTARNFSADLMLLDLDMPDRSGREVIADFEADSKLADIPLIIMTGGLAKGESIEGMSDIPVLRKPFGPKELLASLTAAENRFPKPADEDCY